MSRVGAKLRKTGLLRNTPKDFEFPPALRSDSDNGAYGKVVRNILKDEDLFRIFKRLKDYQYVLEHVSETQGREYLRHLEKWDRSLLDSAIKSVLSADEIGSPVKHMYPGFIQPLSPTTLRYVKVASDLQFFFGTGIELVAEVGCGYGGQCFVNDQLLNVSETWLFDMPVVNQLVERYLNCFLLRGSFVTSTINHPIPKSFDLCISNYAFSELSRNVQLAYAEKVLCRSSRGYLTMNSGLKNEDPSGKLRIEELRQILPEFNCYAEEPLTGSSNYLIVWGHSNESARDRFRPMTIN